ncbi:MAG: VOC family protein, partial [Gemmatimonadetes bacterium]|nr:VOC family protein [Gemmatimonadota bacterium]
SDAPPDRYRKPQGLYVSLSVKDPIEAERIYDALAKGGTVEMPLQETFWSPRFGMVTDRFGTPWMVNCEPAA